LEHALRDLTNQALNRLKSDIDSIRELSRRRVLIESTAMENLHKAIVLIEDCRHLGTLAFAHAARAGFVATSFLNDFVTLDVMMEEQRQQFLAGIRTVTTDFEEDLFKLNSQEVSMGDFVNRYGHLRPGTYDITVPSYREDADRYLKGSGRFSGNVQTSENADRERSPPFEPGPDLSDRVTRLLEDLGIESDPFTLFKFMRDAIRTREEVKFIFTQNLSLALDYLVRYGEDNAIARGDLAHLTYEDLRNLQIGATNKEDLVHTIALRKHAARISQMVELPELIINSDDMYCFERRRSQPNFVTTKVAEAPCLYWAADNEAVLNDKILVISQADPGYDWIFAHGIAGLITQYGGANSHMAIRSAELGLPAAIGVGDRLYESLKHSRRIRLDCNARKIEVVS